MTPNISDALHQEVVQLLRAGKKIDATKHVRAETKLGLTEGKRVVDDILALGEWLVKK